MLYWTFQVAAGFLLLATVGTAAATFFDPDTIQNELFDGSGESAPADKLVDQRTVVAAAGIGLLVVVAATSVLPSSVVPGIGLGGALMIFNSAGYGQLTSIAYVNALFSSASTGHNLILTAVLAVGSILLLFAINQRWDFPEPASDPGTD